MYHIFFNVRNAMNFVFKSSYYNLKYYIIIIPKKLRYEIEKNISQNILTFKTQEYRLKKLLTSTHSYCS